jgi:hypothetical protein
VGALSSVVMLPSHRTKLKHREGTQFCDIYFGYVNVRTATTGFVLKLDTDMLLNVTCVERVAK